MGKRVMFYCQHILGMGHLVRSTEVVRALAHDFDVLFVVGGEIPQGYRAPDGVRIIQLPPIKSDSIFSQLQAANSCGDLEITKQLRREMLLCAFDAHQPEILVTELFPFGRKQFSFELIPLLERAFQETSNGRTMVVCSLRDILVTRKDQPEYEERVCKIVNRFYDLILVHGDPNLQQLGETFLRSSDLLCPVRYTGYVVQQQPKMIETTATIRPRNDVPTIVVSNGGGQPVSGHLFLENCLHAAEILQAILPLRFEFFAGPFMEEQAFQRLQHLASGIPSVDFTRYTPNLSKHLKDADLSISMAGYNTVMDILSTGVRALVSPFVGGGDQEQTVRAQKMAEMGVLKVLTQEQLEPSQLANAILEALRRDAVRIAFNDQGAANSNCILREHLATWSRPGGKHELESAVRA